MKKILWKILESIGALFLTGLGLAFAGLIVKCLWIAFLFGFKLI